MLKYLSDPINLSKYSLVFLLYLILTRLKQVNMTKKMFKLICFYIQPHFKLIDNKEVTYQDSLK